MIETKEQAQEIAKELIELINTPDTDKDLHIDVQVIKHEIFNWAVVIIPKHNRYHLPLASRVFGYVNRLMHVWSIVSYDSVKDIVYVELY